MNEVILLISGSDRCGAENCLAREGFSVRRFSDVSGAMSFVSGERVDLAVLDLDSDLDFPDGLSLLKSLHEKFAFPIILLSGSDELAEYIPFADDFVIKPFSSSELAARVKAQLRRSTRYNTARFADSDKYADSEPSEITIGGLCINNPAHKCRLDGEEIKLTPLEFDILWYLCVRRGRVVSGEELFEAVWGEKYLDSAGTVMPHIARLRGKLREPPRHPKYVKTVWGVGYTVDG